LRCESSDLAGRGVRLDGSLPQTAEVGGNLRSASAEVGRPDLPLRGTTQLLEFALYAGCRDGVLLEQVDGCGQDQQRALRLGMKLALKLARDAPDRFGQPGMPS
jgi:hypothetical protein